MAMSNFFKKIREVLVSFSGSSAKEAEEVNTPTPEEYKPKPRKSVPPVPTVAKTEKKVVKEEVPSNFRKRENAVHCDAPKELLTQTIIPKKSAYHKRKKQNFNKTREKK